MERASARVLHCPVCGDKLLSAGPPAVDTYWCAKRQEYVQDFGTSVDVVDYFVYVDPDGRHSSRIIEIPPYKFSITDEKSCRKTEVYKTVLNDLPPWSVEDKSMFLQKKHILTIPAVMNLPWHDRSKVLERLKLYLLFS